MKIEIELTPEIEEYLTPSLDRDKSEKDIVMAFSGLEQLREAVKKAKTQIKLGDLIVSTHDEAVVFIRAYIFVNSSWVASNGRVLRDARKATPAEEKLIKQLLEEKK